MKKKITQLRWFVTMILFVAAMAMPKMAWAEITPKQPSGEGTAESPYQIGTAAELYWFAALVNGTLTDIARNTSAYAVLVSDITVNENLLSSKLDEYGDLRGNETVECWTPIGWLNDYSNNRTMYSGTFDGQGHSISGLYFKRPNESYASFCVRMEEGTIKNIAIIDSYFEGSISGGICGYAYISVNLINCLFSGAVKSTGYAGGICGASYSNIAVSDCFSNGKILSDSSVGGICGGSVSANAHFKNCVYNSNLFTGNAIKWVDANEVGTQVNVTGMTTDEIASGKAAHWLNSHLAGDGIGWYQNIDNGQTNDAYPVLNNTHGVVYASHPCPSSGTFTNNKSSLTELKHSWGENNVCTQCGKTKDVFDLVEGFQKPSQVGDVYQIGTAGELYWFTALVNGLLTDGTPPNSAANAVLTSDITVNTNVLDENGNLAATSDTRLDWIPIGNYDRPYTGSFNGQGHTISGLYVDRSENYIGLFGYSMGTIKNTSVAASYIKGNDYVGGLCGCAKSATIENCHNSGVVSGVTFVGGLCGENRTGVVQLCSNTGKVSSTDGYIGGIVGNSASSVENCYNEGTITCTAKTSKIGGICGVIFENSPISNSYNVGEVNAPDEASCVGVICGEIVRTGHTISNCYYIPLGDMKAVGEYDMQATESQVINVSSKTADEFKSGEVAYLLNNSKSDGTPAWYQNLSAEDGDAYPVLTNTGMNTVYYGYEHGSADPKYTNSAHVHAHAYGSSAIDEASGNHDKSYRGDFNWADNDDKTNATVTATFTCEVCRKVVSTKALTVENDDSKANTKANCTEKGYNYYKTSYSFAGETFPSTYTQTLDALGHDYSGTASINIEKHIYEKNCKRCSVFLEYCATSDGKVKANEDPEGGFTANDLTLQDATVYDNQAVFTAERFTYNRTFSNANWTTWYVPFDLTLTEEICAKYDFSRINNVHQYDTDNNGTVDKTVVESFRQMPGVTLKANYPYLVKPVSEGDLNMVLPLEGVKPALAITNSIDCQSVDFSYTFTGTYTGMGEGGSNYYDPYTLWTDGTWQHFRSLDPMRHYLTVTPRNSSFASAATLRSIMLSVIGDEGTTGIVNMYSDERKAAETYDLGGRRLPAGASQKGVMIENGKVIIKK